MTIETVKPIVYNGKSRNGVVILCDHATNHVPNDYSELGLTQEQLDSHIAWDPGAADVARCMSFMMDSPAIMGSVSRLLIDCNREPDHPTLIPTVSDGVHIPANQQLNADNIEKRKENYYHPFHDTCEDIISDHIEQGYDPYVIGVHSFTPIIGKNERPWHISFMWNDDSRLAKAMAHIIQRDTNLNVGMNEPYSGKDLYYSMERHGAAHGLPQTTIEIRSDLIENGEGSIRQWAALLADCLDECQARDDLF